MIGNDTPARVPPSTPEEKAAMTQPWAASNAPMSMELEPGKEYYWCSCGLSKNQPFCDGSHQGSKFSPVKFTAKDQKVSYLCMCRRNADGSKPYCDGSHSNLKW